MAAALAILVGFLAPLPATFGYIGFEKIRRSSTLHIPLDYVFSVYGIFMLAVVVRYGLRLWALIRGGDPDADPGGGAA